MTDLFSPRITQLSKSMWEWNLPHGVVPIECYYLSPIWFHFWPFIWKSIILRSLINICCRGRLQYCSKPVHILNNVFIIAFHWFCFSKRAKKTQQTNKNPNISFIREVGSWLIDTSPVLSFWYTEEKILFSLLCG